MSPVVQALPSLQGAVLFRWAQFPLPSQRSSVQTLLSLVQVVPADSFGCVHAVPIPSQTSLVHTFPSSGQAVPAAFTVSAGQVTLVPVQLSATSQAPAEERQTVPADLN